MAGEASRLSAADRVFATCRGSISGDVNRWYASVLPWAAVTFAMVASAGLRNQHPLIADSSSYRDLALGRSSEVLGSIAGRILHPASVRFLAWGAGINIDRAFFVVALIALAVFVITIAWILKDTVGVTALVLPLLFSPVVVYAMFRLYYCQDLFYDALLGCFFVSLVRSKTWLGLALLVPLYLTRESTILLAAVWAIVACIDKKCLVAAICGIETIAGLGVSRMFAALGKPNIHRTSELVFLLLKPPFDALRNLFGIVLVPNEMRGMRGFTCAPVRTVYLPWYVRYGMTTRVGICRPDIGIPVNTLTLWLSLFGIGPAILFAIVRKRGCRAIAYAPLWLKIACVYGLLAFMIAPAVSDWLERDMGYGWPVFWLATPALFRMFCATTQNLVGLLLLENLAACWIPYLLNGWSGNNSALSVAALCVAVAMQGAALITLRGRVTEANDSTGRTVPPMGVRLVGNYESR